MLAEVDSVHNQEGLERKATVKHIKGQEQSRSQTLHRRIFIFSAILALTGLFFTSQLNSKIYQWVDENGVKHYRNTPPANDRDFKKVFDEYEHDETRDQERIKADQREMDALIEQVEKEEQQAIVEKQRKSMEEQKKLKEANQNQPHWYASGCFGPSYSVQQGRGVFGKIIPRDFSEGEYQELKKLFEGLDGSWSGNGWSLYCEEWGGQISEQMDHFLIKSDCTIDSTGWWVLESDLYSRENRTTKHQTLRLHLSEDQLALRPNVKEVEIEVISVSSDELIYLEKRQQRAGGGWCGALKFFETVTTIKKTGEASFSLEKVIYLNGRLISKSIWHQEGG